MSKVLIVSSDVIDENMAGMGMRYWEIAHALSSTCQVTLAIPNITTLSSSAVTLFSFDWQHGDLTDQARQADVIIIQGFVLHFHPYLRDLGIPLAVDLYVPSLLEGLVWHDSDDWSTWIPAYEEYLRVQLDLLRAGDFFFCASERQRDYWLGWLHGQKRINPHTYRDDPSLRKLIDVVPFGLPNVPPPPHHPVLKGIYPNIPTDCRLILWNGGIWDWLDPLTLIRAIADLVPRHPDIRLFFMGTQHPNSFVSGMKMPEQAVQLSRDLGLIDQYVFFGKWVPYHERTNYLLEANLGVVSYLDHIETRFSFRTRVLDCIWTGLPLVLTSGDTLADLVEAARVGRCVPAGDTLALANSIETMLYCENDQILPDQWDQLRLQFVWEKVVIPLAEFCQNPHLAPDKGIYLTEVERLVKDKEAFYGQVIQDKDAFLEQVIHDKDAFLEQVIHDKDAFLAQVVHEKDAYFEKVIQEKEAIHEHTIQEDKAILELTIREKDLVLEKTIREKDEILAQTIHDQEIAHQKIISKKEAANDQVIQEKETAYRQLLDDYKNFFPRLPARLIRFIRRKANLQ